MKKHTPTYLSSHVLSTALIILFVLADQASKFFATTNLAQGPIDIIGGFLRLEKSLNPGIAFGIEVPGPIIIIFSILLLALVVYLIHTELRRGSTLTKIVSALILGGAIGNLVDRIIYGKVVDFIAFNFWPSFNLADTFIVVGVILGVVFYKKIKI